MTQELVDLRTSIIEKRYADALAIVDELEGMSKQAILRNIESYLKILLIHLIKNQVEQRLTNSWVSSIRNSIREMQRINLKENKKSYYVNRDEWENLILAEVIEDAIADASEEVFNGRYSQFKLSEMVNRKEIVETAIKFLDLTYSHAAKDLSAAVVRMLIDLPGGEDWINSKE
jgi:uncharacterized surface protein with fasciclin (FAS1) repeats